MSAVLAALWLTTAAFDPAMPLTPAQRTEAVELIDAMKTNRRGPYQGVSWFCNDGTVLPPKMYACVPHGGGVQYGVLSKEADKLAAMGLYVGTILTALKSPAFMENDYYRCRAYVIETYLERSLAGWTLETARNYRGFRQTEDEVEAARPILIDLAMRHDVLTFRRALLSRVVRAMPYGTGGSLADEVRALAGTIGDADMTGFGDLRFKIHAMPEPSDIDDVEAYAEKKGGDLGKQATELAAKMRSYYDPTRLLTRLKDVRSWTHDEATKKAIDVFVEADFTDGAQVVDLGSALIATADQAIHAGKTWRTGERNLLLLHVMELIEELWLGVTADLSRRPMTRQQTLSLTRQMLRSAQAIGWLSVRENAVAQEAVGLMERGEPQGYATALDHLKRTLEWGRARLVADLGLALQRYEAVEPHARNVIDDQLRSSMMLPLAALLDRLTADVERLRGGGHRLLGLPGLRDAALRGENAGVAIGPLRAVHAHDDLHSLKRNEIVLLHGLPPELPPVAGIITVGAAGSLSHVGILARNLGIPHASIGGDTATALSAMSGSEILLAVSSGRRVAIGPLAALSADERKLVVDRQQQTPTMFEIDASKLDLTTTRIHRLAEISEKDSGIRVGPKAAELGRLKRLFPERVSDAAVIPFGAFLAHVSRPGADDTPSPIERLRHAYVTSQSMPSAKVEPYLLGELKVFRQSIAELPFVDGFEDAVKAALEVLGKPGTFGVFVRSDTNVEDLSNFTGAGLNLTVPNRVRPEEIIGSIKAVWASPFTERSFRWRQRLLLNPEHVYPSVILHRTVPSEVSGVMVTTDLETGSGDALTVSCSEGVAAVVDGGAPETVIIRADGVKLLASSRSATCKRIPDPPNEGVVVLPAKNAGALLGEAEIAELRQLAADVKARIPPKEEGVPWDIEFGFYKGRAYLLQIRPLRISRAASTHPFLRSLDDAARLPSDSLDLGEKVP